MDQHKILKQDDVLKVLASQEFDDLIGVRESQEFEFKSKRPYVFDAKRNTLSTAELAKDVASMGNADGGIIVCGLIRKEENGRDVVDGLDLVSKNDFYLEQEIIGRIKLTVYPTLENISLKWFPSKEDPALGLGVIIIPKQQDSKKFFVVRVCAVGEEILSGVYFGIPIRKDDRPSWFDLKDMKFLRQMIPTSTEEQYMGIMNELKDIKTSLAFHKASEEKVPLKKRLENPNG